jgi:hypothetical protein
MHIYRFEEFLNDLPKAGHADAGCKSMERHHGYIALLSCKPPSGINTTSTIARMMRSPQSLPIVRSFLLVLNEVLVLA